MIARDLASALCVITCLVVTGPATCGAQASHSLPAAPQALPQAAPQPDPFQLRVDRAAQLLDADPQSALEELNHLAVESMELRKTRALTPSERPAHRQLFVLRARAHMQAMSGDGVDESFRELLRVDPFFAQTVAPREQAVLDALRSRESGLLEITSTVRDCTVLVDGVEVGVTGDVPVRASLVQGSYELRLEKPGYHGVGARVVVVATETQRVSDLAPKAQIPPVLFLVDRAAVDVTVDNSRAGVTIPLTELRRQVSAGELASLDQMVAQARFDPATSAGILLRDPPVDQPLLVRFRGPCLVEETRTVSITVESLASLDAASTLLWYGDSSAVRMRPDVGTLRVSSAPTDADVYVDGALVGRSPFERNVCSGEHKVRVRHRLGSYAVSATIARGRTEGIDVTLKVGLAFLGAVESLQGAAVRPAADLTSTIDRALASTVKSFRLATLTDVPTEVTRWNDTSTADLVAAVDRGDTEGVKRLLRLAHDNYDAPLLLGAVVYGPASAANSPVDLLLFWFEHPGVDRVRVASLSAESLATVLQHIDTPADPTELVFQNDLGVRVADTALPEAPLVVVSVDPGSPAALAGLKLGDAIVSVDGAPLTSAELADRVRQKKPGDVLRFSTGGAGAAANQPAIPVQKRSRRAPVFDPTMFGNVITAKLQAALAVATSTADRNLMSANLALVQVRFGQWRLALDLFNALGEVPSGIGIGPTAVLYFRARCHEELGERDRAVALFREAAASGTQLLADDGATVAAVATLRSAALSETSAIRRLP